MKKLLVCVLAMFLMIGVINAEDKAKVKVYLFEAGGCPYCEEEEKYLKSLEGYGKTFEVVKKELYVDHVDWEYGKDYELGKKVAESFNDAGFEDASYEGTPFVVISDLYAAATYSEDLEDFINAAYEEGDKDVVSCIAAGKSNCIRENNINLTASAKVINSKSGVVIAVIGAILLVGVAVYVITNKKNDLEDEVVDEKEEEKEEEEPKKVVKKTTRKTTTTKKTTTRKTTKK